MYSLWFKIICEFYSDLKLIYRELGFDGLLGGFLVEGFLFFLFVAGFAPGADLGGRIRSPGIEVDVIPNAIVSSFYLIQNYITIIRDSQRKLLANCPAAQRLPARGL
jgi:hypothetical protein